MSLAKITIELTRNEAELLVEHLKNQPNPQARPWSWSNVLAALEEGIDNAEPSDTEMGNEPDAWKGGFAENH